MPTTRSANNAKPSSSKSGAATRVSGSRSSGAGVLHDELQNHLSALQRGIQDLTKIQEDLRGRNLRLQDEVDRLHNETDVSIQPSPVKSGGKSNISLQMRVKELELEVRRLKKGRALDRKKIRQLQLKEAHAEAEELQDELLYGVPDVTHDIKKLLQRFQRVVTSPSLEDKEECPICAETLELNECSSLPCQHIFCDICLSKVGDGENISCPQCRRQSNVESFEAVEFTATEQWDQLLEIARQYAEVEARMGPDTSEEEEEEALQENFIKDADDDSSTVSHVRDVTPDTMQEKVSDRDEREDTEAVQIPYSQSGTFEKRRRMKELVSQREHKRLRR